MTILENAVLWRAPLLVGIATCIGACTVGPNYARPSAHVAPSYAEAHGQGGQALGDAQIGARWWEIYGDADLNALVQQVSVGNQSLAAAAARVRQADALLRAAGGARLPSLSAGTVTRGISGRKDFGLQVAWEIDLWGRVRRNVEAHGADAQASADDLAAATLSIQAHVVQSYFALRIQDARVEYLQRAVDVNERGLRTVQNQQKLGVASSAVLAQALTRSGSAQTQLADARLARVQVEHALAVLVGRSPTEFSIAATPLPLDAKVPTTPPELPSQLLERRPGIAAAERRAAAASARIGVSEAERLPSINLAGGIGVLKGWFGAMDLRAALYRGGAATAGVEQSRAAYDEAVANYRQAVLEGFQEVEDSLAAQRILGQAAQANVEVVNAVLESERVAGNQYRAGVGKYDAVVESRVAAGQAQTAALDLLQRRLDTSVALIKALGGGWDEAAADQSVRAQ